MQVLLLKDGIFWYTDNKRDLVTSPSAEIFFEDKIGDNKSPDPYYGDCSSIRHQVLNLISSFKCCDTTV